MGDRDEALGWLERAADQRNDALLFAAVHPGLQSLRGDARFAHVLERVGRD